MASGLTKSSSFSHHKPPGIEWRNTLAARSHSAKNILAHSNYDVLTAEARGPKKHNPPHKDNIKPINDHSRIYAVVQTDRHSNYQPSLSKKSWSSTSGEKEESDHRHAIKCNNLVNYCR